MKYCIVCRTYEGNEVKTAQYLEIQPGRNESFLFSNVKCLARLEWSQKKSGDSAGTCGNLKAVFESGCEEAAAVSIEAVEEGWRRENYLFAPAALYNGNRFKSMPLPYPPYYRPTQGEAPAAPPVITDIPHLDIREPRSKISLLSGDLSVPACGFYLPEQQEGFLLFGKHRIGSRYTGFTIRENLDENRLSISMSCPGVREEYRYFFGEREDGSGFYPDAHTSSGDTGEYAKAGDVWEIPFVLYRFRAETLPDFFRFFNRNRFCLEKGCSEDVVPFFEAYRAIKEKYRRENYISEGTEGYFSVGTDHSIIQQCWQAGWIGGGMNNLPFLLEAEGEWYLKGRSTFRFILDRLQNRNGWITGIYADGIRYGDAFTEEENGTCLLVRKNADLLYFLLKEYLALEKNHDLRAEDGEKIMALADAFVRLYRKYGQIGQFIDIVTEEILIGNTAGPSIAAGALALAAEVFQNASYLETAEALGNDYYVRYAARGVLNGGPGEICQAPDSESAFGLLEAFVQLYETTGDGKWLERAKEVCEIAVTWVMSYDFCFPSASTAGKRKTHTMGTVFANAQNKHSAPGICTLSGNSLLKLYRFTGDETYLDWLKAISHSLTQFVSVRENPVATLYGRCLPEGYMNERVQTSDWEGEETVGEFLYGSNWPEVSMLLTYVEVPGIYVNPENGLIKCFDHVRCEAVRDELGKTVGLKVFNPTAYDAAVTVLAESGGNGVKIRIAHNYFGDMRKVWVKAGETAAMTFVPAGCAG